MALGLHKRGKYENGAHVWEIQVIKMLLFPTEDMTLEAMPARERKGLAEDITQLKKKTKNCLV